MTPLEFLPSFRGDLEEIWRHIAQDNVAAADKVIDSLAARCLTLSAHPYAGLGRPDISPDCRQLVVNGYVVLYCIRDGHVQLVRALHGRRKISDKHFGPTNPKTRA